MLQTKLLEYSYSFLYKLKTIGWVGFFPDKHGYFQNVQKFKCGSGEKSNMAEIVQPDLFLN